jgi:hypothetical protein
MRAPTSVAGTSRALAAPSSSTSRVLARGRALLLGLTLGVGPGLVSGCARSEAVDAPEPLRTEVRVALTFTRIGNGAGQAFEGQGHFVRFAESDADRVPAILGVPDEAHLPLGRCRSVDSAEELDRAVDPTGTRSLYAGGAGAEVRLLDAGSIRVRGPADAVPLSQRHYPEVTPYVSGVIYGNEELRPLTLEPGAWYEVDGDGGEEVGAFSATVQAPRAFPQLDLPVYHRGEDLDVRWTHADAQGSTATEEILLRVGWTSRLGSHEVRCRVHDDGAYTVGRELLKTLPPRSETGIVEVSATRLRQATLWAPGAQRGMLRIGLRSVMPLAVSSQAPVPQAPTGTP